MAAIFKLRPPVPAEAGEQAFWIRSTVPEGPVTSAPLQGHVDTSIAIVGGGLTGLWTAWRIIEQNPEQRVTIVEADFCGSGASGRNGGQVHSWFSSLGYLRALVGKKEALHLAKQTTSAIAEMAELQESGAIDMDLRLDGWVLGASSEAQEKSWPNLVSQAKEHGETPYRVVDAKELKERTGSTSAYQGVIEDHAGSVNPYKLVVGMRRLLIERGVTVYEKTPVTHIQGGSRPVLTTAQGSITADKVLIATSAWAGSIPEINRYMYSVDGQVIVTEPIPELLDELGWSGGQAIVDRQLQVLYFQRTIDGRILLGHGSGFPIFKDKLTGRSNMNHRLVAPVIKELHRMYPSLTNVAIDHTWTGPIDIVATHLPMIGNLKNEPNLLYCAGFSGTALAQIPVVARILASNLLDADDEWRSSRLFNQARRVRIFPEPLRYIGARIVRLAVIRRVRLEIQNKNVDPITKFFVSLMPRYRAPGRTPTD